MARCGPGMSWYGATPGGPTGAQPTPLPPPVQGMSIHDTKDNVQKGPDWLDAERESFTSSQLGPFWMLSLVPWMDNTNTQGGRGVAGPLGVVALWEIIGWSSSRLHENYPTL